MLSKYFKPAINYSSWADRFSSIWTFLLFLILAAIVGWRHYLGPNVSCYTPKDMSSQMSEYVNERCWSARQLTIHYRDRFYEYAFLSDERYSITKESIRTLYQWLPLIIACQALFFRLPDIVLRVCDSIFGYGSSKIVGLVRGYKNLRSIDRTALARELANYFDEIFASRPLKSLGLTALIVSIVKLLFFFNALAQLIVLDGYMSPINATSYGEHVVNSIISRNYSKVEPSPSFPRDVSCYVDLNRYQRKLNYTLQCHVPVNQFNEQVCFFIWIWLLVVCVAAGISLLVCIIRNFIPVLRERFIAKYLRMGSLSFTKTQLSSFTNSVIGKDGILLLKLIREVSSDILVRDIVVKLWYLHFISEPKTISIGVQY